MKHKSVIAKLKKEKGIKSIVWFFRTSLVSYGVAKDKNGIFWSVDDCKTLKQIRARAGLVNWTEKQMRDLQTKAVVSLA